MKNITILLFLFFCLNCFAQTSDSTTVARSLSGPVFAKYHHNKDLSLFVGYATSGKSKLNTHGFELGVSKNHRIPFASAGYYASSEFLFNKHGFLMGPKVGGYASFLIGCIGTELIFYHDFKKSSVHLAPYFGLGFGGFRLAVSPHLPLYNKDFKEKRYLSINVAANIFNFSKKKFYWKD